MKSGQKEIQSVDTGDTCLESYPCQHYVTFQYKDGTKENMGTMSGRTLAEKFFNQMNKEDQQHFSGYLKHNSIFSEKTQDSKSEGQDKTVNNDKDSATKETSATLSNK